jgi:hypothetical protein
MRDRGGADAIAALIVIPKQKKARRPQCITTDNEYGFRTCRFAAIRNDRPLFHDRGRWRDRRRCHGKLRNRHKPVVGDVLLHKGSGNGSFTGLFMALQPSGLTSG